jgi:nucleotide-binding universal stress UspA family protein
MAYRRILVPLKGGAADAHVLKAAFDVAQAFSGHVAGVYVKPNPTLVLRYLGSGVSARVVHEIVEAAEDEAKRAAGTARSALMLAAKAAGAPVQPQAKAGAGLGASFRVGENPIEHEDPIEGVIAEEARLSDVCVFESPIESKDVEMRAALESVLLNGRKPLLLVPHQTTHIAGVKIAIGWDGGAAAAHAVSAAVPLMKRAESIEVLNVTSGPKNTVRMDRLRDYLQLQGLKAIERSVNPGSQDTGSALIDAAQRSGAGLLVIGGYGHSRLRELILGGVTRYVFANAAMPVFMAH